MAEEKGEKTKFSIRLPIKKKTEEFINSRLQQDATFLGLFIYTDALHVSDGSSAHHQEHITVHRASGTVNQYCCLLLSWMDGSFHLIHDGSKQQYWLIIPEAVCFTFSIVVVVVVIVTKTTTRTIQIFKLRPPVHLNYYSLNFKHRGSCILGQAFHTLQRTLFIYLINKYISLSDICLTVHH